MARRKTDNRHYAGIADAIRKKTGTQQTYKPIEMPGGVEAVFEAGKQNEYDRFWDAYQQNGTRTNYAYAFAGTAWTQEQLDAIKYPVVFAAETMTYQCWTKGMFSYLNWGGSTHMDMSNVLAKMDFTNCQRINLAFQNAYVKNINLDLGNCDSIDRIFNCGDAGGKTCENVTLKISEKCTNFNQAFYYCSGLTELRFVDGSVIAAKVEFTQSTKLTRDSIVSIINALSTTTSGLSVTFSKTAVNTAFETSAGAADGSVSAEWAALANSKSNWTINLV